MDRVGVLLPREGDRFHRLCEEVLRQTVEQQPGVLESMLDRGLQVSSWDGIRGGITGHLPLDGRTVRVELLPGGRIRTQDRATGASIALSAILQGQIEHSAVVTSLRDARPGDHVMLVTRDHRLVEGRLHEHVRDGAYLEPLEGRGLIRVRNAELGTNGASVTSALHVARDSASDNGWNRPLETYARKFPEGRLLDALRRALRWVDLGMGEGQAGFDGLSRFEGLELTGVTKEKPGPTAVDRLERTGRFHGVFGRCLAEVGGDEIGPAQVATDVSGIFTYTDDLTRDLGAELSVLEANGELFLCYPMYTVLLNEGDGDRGDDVFLATTQIERHRAFLEGIEGAAIEDFDAAHITNAENGEKLILVSVVLRRTDGELGVPPLQKVRYEDPQDGTTPLRWYLSRSH